MNDSNNGTNQTINNPSMQPLNRQRTNLKPVHVTTRSSACTGAELCMGQSCVGFWVMLVIPFFHVEHTNDDALDGIMLT